MREKIGQLCLALGIFYSVLSAVIPKPTEDKFELIGMVSPGPVLLIVGLILVLGKKRGAEKADDDNGS